jgi:hypothetical protein
MDEMEIEMERYRQEIKDKLYVILTSIETKTQEHFDKFDDLFEKKLETEIDYCIIPTTEELVRLNTCIENFSETRIDCLKNFTKELLDRVKFEPNLTEKIHINIGGKQQHIGRIEG